jgi:hypothetical protein
MKPAKAATPKLSAERAEVVDLMVKLDKETAPYVPKIKQLEGLKKQVQSWPTEDRTGDAFAAAYTGETGSILVGAREIKRSVKDMQGLWSFLGAAKFLANCSFALGKIDKLVPESRKAELVRGPRTGPRPVSILPVLK